jgi:hypothetical protein
MQVEKKIDPKKSEKHIKALLGKRHDKTAFMLFHEKNKEQIDEKLFKNALFEKHKEDAEKYVNFKNDAIDDGDGVYQHMNGKGFLGGLSLFGASALGSWFTGRFFARHVGKLATDFLDTSSSFVFTRHDVTVLAAGLGVFLCSWAGYRGVKRAYYSYDYTNTLKQELSCVTDIRKGLQHIDDSYPIGEPFSILTLEIVNSLNH